MSDLYKESCDISRLNSKIIAQTEKIERLQAQVAALREALEPLAALFLYPDDLGFEPASDIEADPDWDQDANDMQHEDCFVLRRDIRAARAALATGGKDE